MIFEDETLILFQGDSITDAERGQFDQLPLGRGYAGMVASWLTAAYPRKGLQFINRGISGNRVVDLKSCWDADCIDLKPDWVSILIGINDTRRRFDRDLPTSAEAFEADYRHILQRTRDETGAQLILLELFVLPIPPDRAEWRADLDPKIAVVRMLAREFNAHLVPLDGVFAAAAAATGDLAMWAPDGVHPTQAGHALIAQHWLQAVEG